MGYNPENLEKPNKSEQPRDTKPDTKKDLGKVAIGGYNKDKK
jgi:hypothetical protein